LKKKHDQINSFLQFLIWGRNTQLNNLGPERLGTN
jgi:hypothetical protein